MGVREKEKGKEKEKKLNSSITPSKKHEREHIYMYECNRYLSTEGHASAQQDVKNYPHGPHVHTRTVGFAYMYKT